MSTTHESPCFNIDFTIYGMFHIGRVKLQGVIHHHHYHHYLPPLVMSFDLFRHRRVAMDHGFEANGYCAIVDK